MNTHNQVAQWTVFILYSET